ncbi:MAG: glutathione S-transferase family protein, partial [Betaproteobacteria bacterium]|nr:glutathione S-transferase family protein [Betaproteobacteria bacterium]
MIDLYTWGTPNGRKVSIMLEELGAEYRTKSINIGKDEQFSDEFIAISPNNKIPAIIDHDSNSGEPVRLFESG